MRKAITTFKNVRARVCRTTNGQWLAGWVAHLDQNDARIRLQAFIGLDPEEKVIFECYGDGTLVRCAGRISGQSGQDIAIGVEGSMLFEPSTETVRIKVENIQGAIWNEQVEGNLVVLDISPDSLGGLTDRGFTPKAELGMRLDTPNGQFQARAEVINCRADPAETGHYRMGLRIVSASRLDAAMWQRLLEEWAEA